MPKFESDENWKFLFCVILSAQSTDREVVKVAPSLFNTFPTLKAFADADLQEIENKIKSIGLYKAKAKNLKNCASRLIKDFNSVLPSTMDELIALPGVGRKTANVIQSVVYQKAAMAVDTHVFRVSHRIGLVPDSCKTPLSVERMLTKYLPKEIIPLAHHWLILHGRYVCRARAPKCGECGIQHICACTFANSFGEN